MLTARGRDAQREVHQVPQPEGNDQARAFAPLMSVLGDWASVEDVAQLGRDLETARDIQERLLPRGLPNLAGVEIGVALAASKVIGGDFYDFVPMPGGVGIVVGLAVALQVTRLLGYLLYNVSPRDPLAFGFALVVIALASLVASLVPAWRATRTDPLLAMRG